MSQNWHNVLSTTVLGLSMTKVRVTIVTSKSTFTFTHSRVGAQDGVTWRRGTSFTTSFAASIRRYMSNVTSLPDDDDIWRFVEVASEVSSEVSRMRASRDERVVAIGRGNMKGAASLRPTARVFRPEWNKMHFSRCRFEKLWKLWTKWKKMKKNKREKEFGERIKRWKWRDWNLVKLVKKTWRKSQEMGWRKVVKNGFMRGDTRRHFDETKLRKSASRHF